MIVQQQQPPPQHFQAQQHFVLSAVNNSAPMIITTPLGKSHIRDEFINQRHSLFRSFLFSSILAVPSIITQPLSTPSNPSSLNTNTPGPNSTNNKTTKPLGQDRLVCSLCNKVYRSSAGLRYHKRKRHRGNEIERKRIDVKMKNFFFLFSR